MTDLDNGNSSPKRKAVRHEAESEESGRQTPGLSDTNCKQGDNSMGARANRLKALSHPDRVGVDAAGMWEDSYASYPEKSGALPLDKSVETRIKRTTEVRDINGIGGFRIGCRSIEPRIVRRISAYRRRDRKARLGPQVGAPAFNSAASDNHLLFPTAYRLER
jgi:hypothetical protein